MDKIKKYQKIILTLLKDYENEQSSVKALIIADKTKHHYQLVEVGWLDNGKYFYAVPIHFHIKNDGKIWLLENRTEYDLAAELIALKVAPSDIVLSFIPEHVRALSGFAVS
jgi:XisI protein